MKAKLFKVSVKVDLLIAAEDARAAKAWARLNPWEWMASAPLPGYFTLRASPVRFARQVPASWEPSGCPYAANVAEGRTVADFLEPAPAGGLNQLALPLE